MEMFSLTQTEVENLMDLSKTVALRSLVNEGLIDEKIADEWCFTHTIIMRKKSMFRTISNIWKQAEEAEGYYYMCVKSDGQLTEKSKDETKTD